MSLTQAWRSIDICGVREQPTNISYPTSVTVNFMSIAFPILSRVLPVLIWKLPGKVYSIFFHPVS